MTEGPEVDDHVDLEDDNYMEDEEDVDPIEDEAEDGTGDEKGQEQDDELRESSGKEQSSEEADQSPNANKHVEDEDKHATSIDETEREKYEELLSLPPHGSEVFIGGLPKDASEEDLRDLCEPFGEICEVRLMKNKDTGESRGYAFVSFQTEEIAQKAIEELKNKEFKGKSLRCSLSESKHRLFVGNIPKAWSEEQFKQIIHDVGPGSEMIDLKQDALNPGRNRGFAFIEYYNNACADYARQKMSNGAFKLEGNTPTVTWADPKTAPENSAAASQVKALYVKNIPDNTTPEQLKEIFQRHGDVTKVVLPPAKGGQGKGNFGFIHFSERSSALKAVKDMEKYEVEGQVLEVTMAKPQSDKKSEAAAFSAAANYAPPAPYGFGGNPYGGMGAGYGVAAGYQQPVIYGRGPMPSGMQMVPMVLPDGRIGYVLQQPGMQQMPPAQPRRNDRSNGSGGPRGRGGGGDDGGRSRRYRPY